MIREIARRLSLSHLTLLGIFILVAARCTLDADTWWHLAAGRWMVEHHSLMTADAFSFTRSGYPWNLPGWPAQVGMYLFYQVGGPGALNLAVAAIFTTGFWLLSKVMPERDGIRSLLLLMGAVTASVHAIARPAMFTFLFTALALYVLEKYRAEGKNMVWVMALATIVWVNVHSMFYLGALLIGVYLVGMELSNAATIRKGFWRLDRKLALYLVGTLLAMLFNPRGLAGVLYPITAMLSQQQAIQFIYEWQSPDFHHWLSLPFAFLLLALNGSVAFSQRKANPTDFLLAVLFSVMAFYSRRFISLFGLAGALLTARYAAEIPWLQAGAKPASKPWPLAGRIALGIMALFVAGTAGVALMQGIDTETNFQRMEAAGLIPPRAAVEALRNTRGNLFNSYNYGGYLIWALPERAVFVDSRAGDLYGDELLVDNWRKAVMMESGWQDVLDRWEIETVFIEKTWPLAEGLKLAGWRLIYQDDQAVIYARP